MRSMRSDLSERPAGSAAAARVAMGARLAVSALSALSVALLAGWALAGCGRRLAGGMAGAGPAVAAASSAGAVRLPLRTLHLPPGFEIGIFSAGVPGARSMTLSPHGILYVGTREEGKVYALVGGPGLTGGGAPRVFTVASGLDLPNGVAWRDGSLYVAEVSRLLRFDGIDERFAKPGVFAGAPEPRIINASYPKEHHHGWKFIRFGPDGLLYVPVGAPCNICEPDDPIYAAITLVRDNGKVLPLKSKGTAKAGLPYTTQEETGSQVVAVLFSDDVRTDSGRAFGREFRARIPDARVIYVDPRIAAGMSDEVLKAVDEAKTVVAAVYVVPTAGKVGNTVAMADATGTLLQQLLDRAAEKTAIVAMGNPYLAADFPKIENYMCTFSNATVSEVSAIKALFGEIAIRGHLPVSIPNVAQRGTGLDRPAQVASGGSEHAQK